MIVFVNQARLIEIFLRFSNQLSSLHSTFLFYFLRIDPPLAINFVARSPVLRLFVSRFPWTNFFRPRENCKGNNPHCVRVTNESIRVRCDSESLKKDYRSKPEERRKKGRRKKERKPSFYRLSISTPLR